MEARRANHLQLHLFDGEPVVMFRCECGESDCRQTIPMAPESYRDHGRHNTSVLYPGHAVIEDEPMTAEREELEQRVARR